MSATTPPRKSYVYKLRRPSDRSIFYIGKGQGWRLHSHEAEARRGTHRNARVQAIILAEDGVIAEKIHTGLTHAEAVELEALFIEYYGREFEGGALANLLSKGKPVSPETSEKLGKPGKLRGGESHPWHGKPGSLLGVKGEAHPAFGRTHSETTRNRIREANSGANHYMFGKTNEASHWYGRKHSEATKQKLRVAQTGRRTATYYFDGTFRDRDTEIVRLKAEGMTLDKLAEKYGIHRLKVRKIVMLDAYAKPQNLLKLAA